MNWYLRYKTAKFTKTASVTMYVKGFPYEEFPELNNLLDLTHSAFSGIHNELLEKFEVGIRINDFTTDGEDHFEKNGILNLYLKNFPRSAIQHDLGEIIAVVKKHLEQTFTTVHDIKVNTWDDFKQKIHEQMRDAAEEAEEGDDSYVEGYTNWLQSIMRYSGPRVVRFYVSLNAPDTSKKVPPHVNISEFNAFNIFKGILRYEDFTTGGFVFDAGELIKRMEFFNSVVNFNEQMKKVSDDPFENQSDMMKNLYLNFGIDEDTLQNPHWVEEMQERLVRIKKFCEWALQNNYRFVYVA